MIRISISAMLGIVMLSGFALASLFYASSPWAAVVIVAYYAALGVAPFGIAYRREGLRAFSLGFTAWIWGYLILTSILSAGQHYLERHYNRGSASTSAAARGYLPRWNFLTFRGPPPQLRHPGGDL